MNLDVTYVTKYIRVQAVYVTTTKNSIMMIKSFNKNFNLLHRTRNINSIFSTFALFGAASFRILPSVSRIIQGFQDVRFSNESKNIIKSNILELNINC